MYRVVSRSGDGGVLVRSVDPAGAETSPTQHFSDVEFRSFVRHEEPAAPRWVWDDTARWYPQLLAAGIRVQRAHDLRLCHVILRNSELTAASALARAAPTGWDGSAVLPGEIASPAATLFDFMNDSADDAGDDESLAELLRQLEAVTASAEPAGLRLLLAAESVGALIAAEMQFAGLPWRTDIHDRLLTDVLGPRVAPGTRPARLEHLAGEIRRHLDDPLLNPDSQQDLLKALRRTGLRVESTRAWELRDVEHPVIPALLDYKKRSRLLSANGWYWMDTWIVDGRFRPDYVPGGVVTGRWAAKGGGALQLPKQVRGAVVADAGWKLVVADAAQLEPRILAALSRDTAMADAGRGTDLYAGIVASGVVETRDHAKVAMLGAMYGATTGESGRLLPRLARAYPRALGLTEAAARAGERGDIVTTRLGRSSPRPGESWLATQSRASEPDASANDERRARSQARDWGRFTRNFIVQGSAAEWALCWMAEIRKALLALAHETLTDTPTQPAIETEAETNPFAAVPHLVFFLHDEVIVHAPIALADRVAQIIENSAARAGRLLFHDFPVDFPLTVAIVDSYAEAK
ncbi:bifunctional 3'-5' exonuclease/DNA polymerase [Glaciibacter psychrotolerans]|uniref:DNA-directed DNA polymerase n=1 Tax=Glaciibacter psychrotolerans TaxID=670054 RepID=A0A7Z0EC54_9MICO|nr:DNA polymerase-1 [Leifsonia psychrotolerans]